MKKRNKALLVIAAVILIILIAGGVYINDYYRPAEDAKSAIQGMEVNGGNLYLYGDSDKGVIIYPGGKVDEEAYAPMAQMLNEEGFTVVIAKMPVKLAIMGSNKADQIIESHSEVNEWYMIGHSLGGTAMSMYAEKNPEKLSGLVFLGSYPYKDLSEFKGFALAFFGTEDMVLNKAKAEEAENYYPEEYQLIDIQGGNHSGFGCYGFQKGDGEAAITWHEQHEIIVRTLIDYIQ